MKILFDHQIFYYKYGGAAKYFSKLLEYLPRDSWKCTALYPYTEYLAECGVMKCHKKLFRGDSVIMEFLNRPYTYSELLRGGFDVYHQTNFSTEALLYARKKPIVTTYHDSNLSTFDPHPEIVKRQEKSLRRADAIICVSVNTKSDMLNLFDIEESKVKVIYHGIERVNLEGLTPSRIVENKYVLFVGRRSAYKNFDVMARAFSRVQKEFPELKLVCTMAPFTQEEKELFRKLGIEGSVLHIEASEQTMLRLYRDAEVFVFPSRYEGFGMPILEAWQCDCPTIVSDASCFPEIASDASLYFNPDDDAELANKIILILTHAEIRDYYVGKGRDRVKLFSWQTCADKHFEIYSQLQ